ncbi:MAG: PEGA domain-containing protein, partial [Pelagibacterales bacterium]|nr:PEGA domain-containing protein [Pelagibacterales bacterium]
MYRKANKYLVLLVSFLIFGFTQGRKEIIALSDVSAEGLKSFEIKSFSNRLESELVNLNKYDVTSRQEIDKIINEQKFQYSGCTDQQCAAEIGKMLNADIMLLSNILYDKDSKYLNITLKIVDVESAKIRTALSKDIMNNTIIQSLDNIEQYLKELYRKDNQSDQPEIIINPNIQQKGLGNINITTDPIGSNVILDNESKGLSPLFLEKIEEGSHRIILNFEGYERVAEVVTVYTDSTVNVNKKLVPLTGHLTIKSTPSGADIFINEEYKGKAPLDLEYLDVGSYYITFKMEGYEETFQPVSVDWNQDNLVNQKLVPLPAKVAFFSVPTGADVYVDSKIMGKTDNAGLILEIQAGSHTIKMKKKGYEPETININPSPGENIDVDLSLEKLPQGVSDNPLAGWVSLTGSPSDALIKYNGNIINAPAKFLELEKGRYNFKVSREGYKSTTQSVLLAPRKHQEIKYQLY